MSQNHEPTRIRWKLLLTVALASVALIAAVAGTTAWLSASRSLTTLTKIDFVTLTLEGKTTDSEPVDLGTLNINTPSKEMPFRIVTKKGAKYVLQLAHTTNLPLTYEIYTAKDWYENGAEKGAKIKEASDIGKTYAAETYTEAENKDRVQTAAQPLYWISGDITAGTVSGTNIDYYVLVVSWEAGTTAESVINKDTEMVYLSASLLTTNTETTGGTGDAESSEPTA